MSEDKEQKNYRGRIAPTPSGYLHMGHAKTFQTAWNRARQRKGDIIFRNDDLDLERSRKEFTLAAMEDLVGLQIDWDEGPDCGGPYGPYNQSERSDYYKKVLYELAEKSLIYPCQKSRKEIQSYGIKDQLKEEFLFPKKSRPSPKKFSKDQVCFNTNWRFRTNLEGEITFFDYCKGKQNFVIGKDFSDFLVWRKDGVAAYELATVVDDFLMEITEVVRGEDLLTSSARQCIIFDAMNWARPNFYHCELIFDKYGRKLSKSQRNLPRLNF